MLNLLFTRCNALSPTSFKLSQEAMLKSALVCLYSFPVKVWAVTVGGRVVVRQGVTSSCPEGKGWLHVPTPVGREVAQLSVAPSGLVWAVTWGGGALVRLGVARLEPSGLAWVEVEPPRPEQPLVGTRLM